MDASRWFDVRRHDRSERALQAHQLVPALRDAETRWALLSALTDAPGDPITRDESNEARVLHFVWVLRDQFTLERDEARAQTPRSWSDLRARWTSILALPPWAAEPRLWERPSGRFDGDAEFVVHPCYRTIGWTDRALADRAARAPGVPAEEVSSVLVAARKTMNTECDCLIQTPRRLLVVECKDKTDFHDGQDRRQDDLRACLVRLLPRDESPEAIDVSSDKKAPRDRPWWSWESVESTLVGGT